MLTTSRGAAVSVYNDVGAGNYLEAMSQEISSDMWSGLRHIFMEWYESEKKEGLEWTESLPACPLKLEIKAGHTVPENPDRNVWLSPRESGPPYHPGAKWEIRSKPTSEGYGQQCCYSPEGNSPAKDGSRVFNLIIYDENKPGETIGAGTPDKGGGPGITNEYTESIEAPACSGLLSGMCYASYGERLKAAAIMDMTTSASRSLTHVIKDVAAFKYAYWLDEHFGGFKYRVMYNEVRPPNKGKR